MLIGIDGDHVGSTLENLSPCGSILEHPCPGGVNIGTTISMWGQY